MKGSSAEKVKRKIRPEGIERERKAAPSTKAGGKKSFRVPLWQSPVIGALAIASLVLIAYIPAIRAGYIWDDDFYVTNNMTLRSLAGLKAIWFEIGATPQYYPLVFTSFWIEYHLWGLHPFGFHLNNVLLHIAGSLLLWAALRRLRVQG